MFSSITFIFHIIPKKSTPEVNKTQETTWFCPFQCSSSNWRASNSAIPADFSTRVMHAVRLLNLLYYLIIVFQTLKTYKTTIVVHENHSDVPSSHRLQLLWLRIPRRDQVGNPLLASSPPQLLPTMLTQETLCASQSSLTFFVDIPFFALITKIRYACHYIGSKIVLYCWVCLLWVQNFLSFFDLLSRHFCRASSLLPSVKDLHFRLNHLMNVLFKLLRLRGSIESSREICSI